MCWRLATTSPACPVRYRRHLPVNSGDGDEWPHAVAQGDLAGAAERLFYRRVYPVDGTGVRLSDTALGYTLWTFFMNGFSLLSWAMVARRREASSYLRLHWKKGLLGGVGTMGSYGLALWAMTRAPLAVVAALRETSILFGALIAFVLLKEKVAGLRIAAALGIAAGAILLRPA